MAELDWDLWAVVRSCSGPAAAAATPADAQEELGTLSLSVVFHQNDNSFGRRPYHGFEELHEVYNSFIKSSQASISPSTSSPTSSVSLFDGFNHHHHHHQPPLPLPPHVEHNSNPADQCGDDERKRSHRTEVVAENLVEADPWNWRKYGRKPIKTSPYPRNYYKCSSSCEGSKCPAKKYVEKSKVDPEKVVISYSGEHNHSPPHKIIRTH